jgi:hypothetical protein
MLIVAVFFFCCCCFTTFYSVFFSSFLVKLLFLVFTSDFGLAIDEGENGTQMDFILLLLFFFFLQLPRGVV